MSRKLFGSLRAFHPGLLKIRPNFQQIMSLSSGKGTVSDSSFVLPQCVSDKFVPCRASLPVNHGKLANSAFLSTSSSTPCLNSQTCRTFSSTTDAPSQSTEGEKQLSDTIRKCFPGATKVIVEDISGGCGSMYSVYIEASEFKGLSTVKQHLLVNQALKQEIKSMHGIRMQTSPPKN